MSQLIFLLSLIASFLYDHSYDHTTNIVDVYNKEINKLNEPDLNISTVSFLNERTLHRQILAHSPQ